MVLADLGNKITSALRMMSNSTLIDEDVIDAMVKEICNALVQSDVSVKMVLDLRKNIKAKINLEEMAAGLNKRKIVKQVVFEELILLLGSKVKPFTPKKGKANVFMFVGLQGSGKTTTVTKLAYHYKKKGWRPGLVCADTFRAGAYDQLKQNATKARLPFFGSYTEADPVKVALDGVNQMKEENHDIIIVDTSGRHKQEEELFLEMEEVSKAVQPDCVVFVMDSSIGQAAFEQAKAFKERVSVGAVIITKMDGHAKGGGALSAVAATEAPIIFLGTGEQIPDLDVFDAKSFVARLLGMGDFRGMIEMIEEVVPAAEAGKMAQRLTEGKFSMRDMYEQFQNFLNMGHIGKMVEMLPGFANLPQLQGNEGNLKLKGYLNIMDSMTDKELDSFDLAKVMNQSRIQRIARGAGRSAREVSELMEQYKQFSKMIRSAKGIGKGNNMRNLSQMANLVPPQMMKQMGGFGGLQQMMKNFTGK